MSALRDAAMKSKAWPFEEARRLQARYARKDPEKGYVLFETGYGPSGLPHIGTFGEVARTTMIRRAFEVISDIPTRMICFSDDLDGMRKIPDNVPQQEMLALHRQKPLTSVPDPFGEYESFGAHNNAMLRRFLDTFGFEYEFISATEFYRSGQFDATLLLAAERYDAIMDVMLASLREERQQTYSCFLPIHPETGRVLYVPIKVVDAVAGTGIPVFPVLNYGLTPSFVDYPGTVTLRLSTLCALITDVLDGMVRSGFDRITIVNGHGGNSPAHGAVLEWLDRNRGVQVKWHNWWSAPATMAHVQRIDPIASHASWMENFPWTRLGNIAMPATGKQMLDLGRFQQLDPGAKKAMLGDGNYGGLYQRADEEMLAIWDTAVAETRTLITEGWA